MEDAIRTNRAFLKDTLRLQIDFRRTDQNRGMQAPPLQKPPRPEQPRIALPALEEYQEVRDIGLVQAIAGRRSWRDFLPEPLTLGELSFLLWATQGVRGRPTAGHAFRVVPSAGCRHAFETYIAAMKVKGLAPALYRYLPLDHALVLEREVPDLANDLISAALGQEFAGEAAATFIWACIPYRMEWRYGPAAHRVIAFDVGHVCQNLYLAVQVVAAGTCAVAAYHQELLDRLLGVDGEDEFAIYMAPVGKVRA
jgi:SagB-type dehydrogenase family enzyme